MAEGQKSGPSEDEYQGQISSIQQIFAEHLGGYYRLAMGELQRAGFEMIVTDLVLHDMMVLSEQLYRLDMSRDSLLSKLILYRFVVAPAERSNWSFLTLSLSQGQSTDL